MQVPNSLEYDTNMTCDCTKTIECESCKKLSLREKPFWYLREQELEALRKLEHVVRTNFDGIEIRKALAEIDAARIKYVKDGEPVPTFRTANS